MGRGRCKDLGVRGIGIAGRGRKTKKKKEEARGEEQYLFSVEFPLVAPVIIIITTSIIIIT